jgi:hypothetical protein
MLVVAACTSNDLQSGVIADCQRTANPDHSVARIWNEVTLKAIRRDFPAPTAHARNLFHVSAAMWDSWAAYDPDAVGYFVDEDRSAEDVVAAREAAMSFAAYRLLSWRYQLAFGAEETEADLDATMHSLCFATELSSLAEGSPAAFGDSIARRIIAFGRTDGSKEDLDYVDETYQPVNDPLVLLAAGTEMTDPNRWQPLAFVNAESQNRISLRSNVQEFVGPHWGQVESFALLSDSDGLPIDPGPPPYLGDPVTDAGFREAVLEVIRFSSRLDPGDGEMIDISPGSVGNNPLGTYDGAGRGVNPLTGAPYEPNVVSHADYGRVIAEFWADGPDSETPPGHWNTIANAVSDRADQAHRLRGTGEELDRLEWDVKLYFALNGALHDGAVAAWGAKGHYDYVRPISMIRYMGTLGQSSDSSRPSYHPDGLPLVEGLVELITAASSAPGERHAHLASYEGEVAVLSWAGNPGDPETEVGGVDWIRAKRWAPYQRATFVTPAFAGYVSGHSTFSRAAAEVLAAFTGSEFFPGGLGEWTIPADALEFEAGPEEDVVLQWATYYDAADQAGLSRLYGGIHVRADDLAGRIMGAECGRAAWEKAQRYYDGSASPLLTS